MAETVHGASARERASAYAAVVRLPNLFTAPPDVLLGATLAGVASGATVPPGRVAGIALASMMLYGAGTTLNDYADADVDAVERPERPIPSGTVSPRAALALGCGLLCAGVAVAFAAAGAVAAAVAGALAAAVLLYDFPLKGTRPGFATMGTARGLNVLLGAAVAGLAGFSLSSVGVAVLVTGYVACVTWMASGEATGGDRRAVLATGGAAVVVAGAVPTLGASGGAASLRLGVAVALAVAFLGWIGPRLRAAYRSPDPGTVGPAVGRCVFGLVVLDAAFVALADPAWAAATLGFLAPATALSRRFDVS